MTINQCQALKLPIPALPDGIGLNYGVKTLTQESSPHLDRQRVEPLVEGEFQGGIDLAVLVDPAFAAERRSGDTDAVMRVVGRGGLGIVAGMQVALIDDFENRRREGRFEGGAESGFERHDLASRQSPQKDPNFPVCQFLRCGMPTPIMSG